MAPSDKLDEQYPRVNFRLGGGLDKYVTERVENGSKDATAKRDLGRYYFMLRISMPTFSMNEAMLMVDVFNGTIFQGSHEDTPHGVTLIWASVSDALAEGYAEKWEVDGPALVNRLHNLSPFECMALADAVERVWNSPTYAIVDMEERVKAVGMVREQ